MRRRHTDHGSLRLDWFWTVEDLALEMEVPSIIDSVRALQRAGLVHRTSDGFVFATRPAVRMVQLVGRVI